MFSDRDILFMQRAIALAEEAAVCNEVPIGAVLVRDDEIMGEGYNCSISKSDPTAHAEIVALRRAAEVVGNYRLVHTTLYVTLEPCVMCAGAMVHARVERLVYGARDAKAGVIVSQAQLFNESFLNHRIDYAGGLLEECCRDLLKRFFETRRQ